MKGRHLQLNPIRVIYKFITSKADTNSTAKFPKKVSLFTKEIFNIVATFPNSIYCSTHNADDVIQILEAYNMHAVKQKYIAWMNVIQLSNKEIRKILLPTDHFGLLKQSHLYQKEDLFKTKHI